jgi:uncharacterized membrane protein (DUF485 family)
VSDTPSPPEVYDQIARTGDFAELRRRYIGFVVPATAAFILWYVMYLICTTWARDLLATKVLGELNVALILGLLQIVSTVVIASLYARYAYASLDPLAGQLREEFDQSTAR